MKQILKSSQFAILAGSICFAPSFAIAAKEISADDRYVYIGVDYGISEPIIKEFDYKESKFRLKQSQMYGARVGYAFYPGMMIELSTTYSPKFKLGYTLPSTKVAGGVFTIPETDGITNVTSNVYTLNLIYEFQKKIAGLKPYAIAGAGVAQISVKPTISTTTALAPAGIPKATFFRIHKTNSNCLVYQFGGGLIYDIGDNVSLDLGARIQVVNDIKINYDTLNDAMGFDPQTPIKKTIGVGEFTLGITFKLPI